MKQKFDKELYTKIVKLNIAIRLLFGPLILVYPILSTLVEFILDWADGEFFKRAGFPKAKYEYIDKLMDYYWYFFILIFILFNPVPSKHIFYFFFTLRTFGQVIYFIQKNGKILFFFPNIFEVLFYVYIVSLFIPSAIKYLFTPKLYLSLAFIIPSILIREYMLHFRKSNLSWFFTGVTTYWEKD